MSLTCVLPELPIFLIVVVSFLETGCLHGNVSIIFPHHLDRLCIVVISISIWQKQIKKQQQQLVRDFPIIGSQSSGQIVCAFSAVSISH
jgi:hypothetical protein